MIAKQNYDTGKLIYSNNKVSLQIYFKDIQYISRDTIDRKLIIKTTNNEFVVNIPIQDMLKMLDGRFSQCHRSCIINEDRVVEKNYLKSYFTTDTGEVVPLLSRRFRGDK